MTNSTITRERAQQIFLGNGPEPSASEERELARMALAAMGSEPVYQVFEPSDGRWVDVDDEEEMIRLRSIGGETRTLYTAQPLPASGVDVVYQLWSAGIGQWVECDKQRFDDHSNLTAQRRILYSHAQPTVDSEPVAWRWRWSDDAEGYWRYTEEQRETHGSVTAQPLYRHAQQPVVDADDNFYSWFGREWQENYQHNQYTTAAKQMLGVMAESAWKAGRLAAMLQAGTLTNEDTRQVDELTMWIKRLVRSLKNANPDSKLPRDAMDYLTAKGLISVGDILR